MPVYGKWAVTADCLRHLKLQTVKHRVILVDDASPDDTLVQARLEFPEIDIVEMGVNSGFAAACNKGIESGSADIVVLVNNDVNADPRMLELLVEPFEGNSRTGSSVPLLLKPDGSVDAFGLSADPTMAGFVRFNGASVDEISSVSPLILGPYGAVAAYRRAALEEVGTFDPGIFMYGEELDLAFRLRNAGWGVAAVSAARGVHVGGATTGKNSAKQRYLAGYGRGYLLRAYGVVSSRHWLRALVTEALVCGIRLFVSKDLASLKGRVAGWKGAKVAAHRPRPSDGVDSSIGFVTSLRMRSASYWTTRSRQVPVVAAESAGSDPTVSA